MERRPTQSGPGQAERRRLPVPAAADLSAEAQPEAASPPALTRPAVPLSPASVRRLQRQLGNAHVARRLAQREEAPAAPAAAPAGLIVEDASAAQPGQLSKAAFLARLRPAVEATVQGELAGSPLLEPARQQVDQQFARYAALDAAALERAIRAEVPRATRAAHADDYIPPILDRVRAAVAEQRAQLPPGAEAAGGLLQGAAGMVGDLLQGAGRLLSGIGGLLFKARPGGARPADDPRAIQARLGAGQSLDGRLSAGLGAAFGQSLSGVRVHSDADAGALAEQMNARAFTVGRDIAFAPGEYRPGTLAGDALIAHELAHVAQQGGADAAAVREKGPGDYDSLERDADRAALGGVLALWGGVQGGLASLGRQAIPQLRSGLRLQRCVGAARNAPGPAAPVPAGPVPAAQPRLTPEQRFEQRRLVAADLANPAITSRLYALSRAQLREYRDQVADPAVQEYIGRLLDFSTEVGADAVIQPDGSATLPAGATRITVLPDAFSQNRRMRRAETSVQINSAIPRPTSVRGRITAFTPPPMTVTIQTTYPPSLRPDDPSGYGRGTTAEDRRAGTTTLRHHEGSHGADYIEYIRSHPLPAFTGAVGMTARQWNRAVRTFGAAMRDYRRDMDQFSERRTDQVGSPTMAEYEQRQRQQRRRRR